MHVYFCSGRICGNWAAKSSQKSNNIIDSVMKFVARQHRLTPHSLLQTPDIDGIPIRRNVKKKCHKTKRSGIKTKIAKNIDDFDLRPILAIGMRKCDSDMCVCVYVVRAPMGANRYVDRVPCHYYIYSTHVSYTCRARSLALHARTGTHMGHWLPTTRFSIWVAIIDDFNFKLNDRQRKKEIQHTRTSQDARNWGSARRFMVIDAVEGAQQSHQRLIVVRCDSDSEYV